MVKRLLERAKTSGRVDDNLETIKQRLKVFNEQTTPVIDYYKKQGKIRHVNSENAPDIVFSEVEKILDRLY
jgi:adenylate kinase family enzyme